MSYLERIKQEFLLPMKEVSFPYQLCMLVVPTNINEIQGKGLNVANSTRSTIFL
jgi:hypothetical protein